MERNPVTISGETLRKTVSIGVAARGRGESSTDWIKRADSAMYAAKDGGRNRTNVSVM
jgi:diguanylate cyclase (GGDEF)-like protein